MFVTERTGRRTPLVRTNPTAPAPHRVTIDRTMTTMTHTGIGEEEDGGERGGREGEEPPCVAGGGGGLMLSAVKSNGAFTVEPTSTVCDPVTPPREMTPGLIRIVSSYVAGA